MIEAVMFQHELLPPRTATGRPERLPYEPDWGHVAVVVRAAARAVHAVHPAMPCVLGGPALADPAAMLCLEHFDLLPHVQAIAVQGVPLDDAPCPIEEWPMRLAAIAAMTTLPVWVADVGVTSNGLSDGQGEALDRAMGLLLGHAARLHWYTLLDGPTVPASVERRSATDSTRRPPRRDMGLLGEDGSVRPALERFTAYLPTVGVSQGFRFEDPRLDHAVRWMRELGVRKVRVPVWWQDGLRPGALVWFDRLLTTLSEFDVTLAFPFTTNGVDARTRIAKPPGDPRSTVEGDAYGTFCAAMVARYAPPASSTSARFTVTVPRHGPWSPTCVPLVPTR